MNESISSTALLRVFDRVLEEALSPEPKRPYKAFMMTALLYQVLPFEGCRWKSQTEILKEIEERYGKAISRQALNKAGQRILATIEDEVQSLKEEEALRDADIPLSSLLIADPDEAARLTA